MRRSERRTLRKSLTKNGVRYLRAYNSHSLCTILTLPSESTVYTGDVHSWDGTAWSTLSLTGVSDGPCVADAGNGLLYVHTNGMYFGAVRTFYSYDLKNPGSWRNKANSILPHNDCSCDIVRLADRWPLYVKGTFGVFIK